MQLRIDGKPIASPEGFDRVGPLIDHALIETESGRRVTSRVWIDGAELDGGALDQLASRATAEIAKIEVETRSIEEVAYGAIESAAEYSVHAADGLCVAANAYRLGHVQRGSEVLADCIDALVVLFEALRGARAFVPDGGDLARFEGAIAPALKALEGLQRGEDWLAVADLIEFEIAGTLTGWPAELSRFLDQATKRP